MNKERILLKLVLDEMGLGKLELDTFSKRFEVQKKIYLLQLRKLDLRYRYNWYLHGPYCSSLARDAFILKEELDSQEDDYTEYKLTDDAKEKIEKAKAISDVPSGVKVKSEVWLELLASLHYLKHIAYWPGNSVTKEKICETLVEAKPHFTNPSKLLEKAWKKLDEVGLVENKTLA